MSVQVFPGSSAQTTVTVSGGRTYTCAVGAVITVPDADALQLMAAGWCRSAHGTGSTANRPTGLPNGGPLPLGFEYFDTTLSPNANVIWNGKTWVHHATGASA